MPEAPTPTPLEALRAVDALFTGIWGAPERLSNSPDLRDVWLMVRAVIADAGDAATDDAADMQTRLWGDEA